MNRIPLLINVVKNETKKNLIWSNQYLFSIRRDIATIIRDLNTYLKMNFKVAPDSKVYVFFF